MLTSIFVSFPVGVASSLLAAWLFKALSKSNQECGYINRKRVVFKAKDIEIFIDETIVARNKREDSREELFDQNPKP